MTIYARMISCTINTEIPLLVFHKGPNIFLSLLFPKPSQLNPKSPIMHHARLTRTASHDSAEGVTCLQTFLVSYFLIHIQT